MSKTSLLFAGACCLAIACTPDEKASEPASASAKASASAAKAPAPSKVKSARARQHLPSTCDIAVEVDAQQLFENPLIGPQLLSSVVPPKDPKLRAQVMADPEQASFLEFLEAAKIEPQRDLQTVAFCLLEGEAAADAHFVAIIAGKFPTGLIDLFRDHAPPSKQYTVEPLGKGRALFREGKWLTQGAGNVVLFSNDKDLLLAAKQPSKAYESYGMASAGDVSATLSKKALASLEGPANDPLVSLLRQGKKVQLNANLGAGDLKGAVTLADAAAVDQFDKAIQTLRSQLKLQSQQAPPQLRQMMQPTIDVLEKTKFTKKGKQLEFAVHLPSGMLESALQRMAMFSLSDGAAPAPPGNMMAMAPGQAVRPRAAPIRRRSRAARPQQRAKVPQAPPPVAPLPALPKLELTPPSVLQGKPATTPPLAEPKKLPAPKGG